MLSSWEEIHIGTLPKWRTFQALDPSTYLVSFWYTRERCTHFDTLLILIHLCHLTLFHDQWLLKIYLLHLMYCIVDLPFSPINHFVHVRKSITIHILIIHRILSIVLENPHNKMSHRQRTNIENPQNR